MGAVSRAHEYIEVLPYSPANLDTLLERASGTPRRVLMKGKLRHRAYLRTRLGRRGLDARTIVIEHKYTDRDWLEDYADFYVRCLEKYESRCIRLHFFDKPFGQDDLMAMAADSSSQPNCDQLPNGAKYLGFMVIRPLPKVFIGRTCLSPLPGDRKNSCIAIPYEANLLGFRLRIESVPFQEQDRVAAACATSALWSAFHATGTLFHNRKPSPIRITRNATAIVPSQIRDVPNHGLTVLQMAQAIRLADLTPEAVRVDVSREDGAPDLLALLRAYLSAGIPVIMNGHLLEEFSSDSGSFYQVERLNPSLLHSVTVLGVAFDEEFQTAYPPVEVNGEPPISPRFKAFRIRKLIVHDDQVGPYTHMNLDDPGCVAGRTLRVSSTFEKDICYTLSTSWRPKDVSKGIPEHLVNARKQRRLCFAPETALLPLYHKIRLPFMGVVWRRAIRTACVAERIRRKYGAEITLIWDIRLVKSTDLKMELRGPRKCHVPSKTDILALPMPRFVWRLSAYANGELAVDLLYDATDIPNGEFQLKISPIFYSKKVYAVYKDIQKLSK